MTRAPYYDDGDVTLHHGHALDVARTLPTGLARTIITSPPYYGLRDYGHDDQLGAESTVADYVGNLVTLFRELRRVLTDDGTLWINLGDSYASSTKGTGGGHGASTLTSRGIGKANGVARQHSGEPRRLTLDVPEKNLLGIPWRVAFALQADGWILRSDIIWAKPNPMPESVTDRPTKAHEYVFLLAKSPRYYYDADAIAEDSSQLARPQTKRALALAAQHGIGEQHLAAIRAVGVTDTGKAQTTQDGYGKNTAGAKALAAEAKRALGGYYREFLLAATVNRRTVWTVPTMPFPGAHFAVYPPELIRPCILAGSAPGDVVLDPFSGSGTTGAVAGYEGRRYLGIDVNSDYLDLSIRTRFAQPTLGIEAV